MSKPVEIEFLMKDSLSGGLEKAGRRVGALADSAGAAADLINAKIAEQRKVIDGVSSDLSRMERQLSGMKPGSAQRELAADVSACRKVLAEERGELAELEKRHREAEKSVRDLEKGYAGWKRSEEQAAAAHATLADRIAGSRELIKGTESDIKALEKAYRNAAPGNAKSAALAELNAARSALAEEKNILAALTAEQEKNRESGKRLSMQLREMQDAMARMRLEGRQDTEEYRKMSAEAANLADTIADLRTQTNILSNDDANLQGFMSGVSGLSGLFTAATGAVGLFASENENLARIQARVQSVMAVTMGLQQVFNTLNKDSAFRLVTVVKMKNLLTAANTRLATSLGISTVAARALMGTLTLGLSVAVGALIYAFDKYSDAQEKAAEKARELVEIESDGRAGMLKARFELDAIVRSLKEFTGSKAEEKKKVEELNRKYGESFGYYDTVAQWYDILIQKSDAYVQMLFLQAKAQSMVNKAVELDAKVAEARAKPESEYDTWWGYGGKVDRFFSSDASYKNSNNGRWLKTEEVSRLEKERDEYLDKAQEEMRKSVEQAKNAGLGGHTKPDDPDKAAKERERRLALEKGLADELLSFRRRNLHDELSLLEEGKAKKLAQVRQEYADRMAEIASQESKWKEARKGTLSREQTDELERARTNARDKQEKDVRDVERESLEAEAEAMRDYLKEYGTFQQRKLAITEEYADKIRKAATEGERLSLGRERDSALRRVDLDALDRKIDWQSVFGDFSGILGTQLKETLDGLKSYVQTDRFRNSPDADRKVVYEAIERLREVTPGGEGTLNFNRIRSQMDELGAAINRLQTATVAQETACATLKKADEDYAAALRGGDRAAVDRAAQALELARMGADAADAAYRSAESDVQDFGNNLRAAGTDTVDGLNSFADGLQSFTDGTLPGIFRGLQNTLTGLSKLNIGGAVGDAIGKMSQTLSSAGVIGQIISAVLSILDILKDGVGPLVSTIIDTILGAVNGILDNILSGDMFVQIFSSVKDGVGNILNTLTFGGFDSWFGIGGNRKEVEDTINRLTERNELLQTAIEDLTEEIKASKGTKSVAAYRQAYENQKQTNANYLDIALAQAGYHGSHHSWNKYWDGFNENQLAWIRRNVRGDFNGDLFSLSPEEMKKLRGNVDIWSSIQNTGKGGYGGRLTEKLDDYIAQAGKLEELTSQLYEGLTGISFDGMYGSFVDNLMDMKYDAKTAAEDISEYFMRAMLSNKIGEMYSDKLKAWWEKFGRSMEDNELTEAERNALAEEYMGYVEEALALRDKLAEATGYDPDRNGGAGQSGKPGGFTAMTQDQGTKLEGMFTGGLQHWSSMDSRLENVSDKMNLAEGHLAKIEENTGISAGHLGEIKEEIRKIIRDGLKMK